MHIRPVILYLKQKYLWQKVRAIKLFKSLVRLITVAVNEWLITIQKSTEWIQTNCIHETHKCFNIL